MAKIDSVVEAYVRFRDAKTALKRKHSEELAPMVERMRTLEVWLQRELQRQGVQSFKTKQGTAFLQESNSATVHNWDETLGWILDKEEYAMLEARVSKSVVRDHIESTGEVPPGVNWRTETVCRVRR